MSWNKVNNHFLSSNALKYCKEALNMAFWSKLRIKGNYRWMIGQVINKNFGRIWANFVVILLNVVINWDIQCNAITNLPFESELLPSPTCASVTSILPCFAPGNTPSSMRAAIHKSKYFNKWNVTGLS